MVTNKRYSYKPLNIYRLEVIVRQLPRRSPCGVPAYSAHTIDSGAGYRSRARFNRSARLYAQNTSVLPNGPFVLNTPQNTRNKTICEISPPPPPQGAFASGRPALRPLRLKFEHGGQTDRSRNAGCRDRTRTSIVRAVNCSFTRRRAPADYRVSIHVSPVCRRANIRIADYGRVQTEHTRPDNNCAVINVLRSSAEE